MKTLVLTVIVAFSLSSFGYGPVPASQRHVQKDAYKAQLYPSYILTELDSGFSRFACEKAIELKELTEVYKKNPKAAQAVEGMSKLLSSQKIVNRLYDLCDLQIRSAFMNTSSEDIIVIGEIASVLAESVE